MNDKSANLTVTSDWKPSGLSTIYRQGLGITFIDYDDQEIYHLSVHQLSRILSRLNYNMSTDLTSYEAAALPYVDIYHELLGYRNPTVLQIGGAKDVATAAWAREATAENNKVLFESKDQRQQYYDLWNGYQILNLDGSINESGLILADLDLSS